MLESIMKAFLRGLADPDVRREATRGLASPDRSLLGIYNLAEEARRTKAAVQKLDEEERKAKENDILRALVQKTISKDQLDNLVSSFQANARSAKASPAWNLEGLHMLLDKLNREGTPGRSLQQSAPPSNYTTRPALAAPGADGYPSHYPGSYAGSNLSRRPDRSEPVRDRDGFRKATGGPNSYRATPRDLPDKSKSKNPYISGTKPYSLRVDGPMCVRCGELKSKKDDGYTCIPLPAWEQSYLRELVFDTPAQVSFAAAGFGDFDGRTSPWKPSPDPSEGTSSSVSGIWTPTTSTHVSQSNSVTYGVSSTSRAQSVLAEAFYDETSGPGKRPRVEEIPDSPGRSQAQVQQSQQPSQPQQSNLPQSQLPITFQANDTRQKIKPKKRVGGKKAEPMPLVGLFDELTGSYDSPVSVRAVLQQTKVELSLLNLVAWSPSMGRELKRLCTRVTKKREKKKPAQQGFVPQQFNPILNQQYAMPQTFNPLQQPPAVPRTFNPLQQSAAVPQVFNPLPQQQSQQPPAFTPAQQSQQSQGFVPLLQPQPSAAPIPGVSSNSVVAQPDAHTKFLSTMVGKEKAFRVAASVRSEGSTEQSLARKQTQVDQGSEMNVVNPSMAVVVKAKLRPLAEVGFKGLTMQTADSFESTLEHYVGFDVCVEGIWRSIRCFVSPARQGLYEEPRLLLGLPWLYSVDAFISVRLSLIRIGDPSIGETARNITGPELVYHRDQNMIMYPKAIRSVTVETVQDPESGNDEEGSSEESEDELSDVSEDF